MVEQTELNRLFWHSRRGMLELDVLLVPFTQEVYATLNEADRELKVRLLSCEDQDMLGWFMERTESEYPELQRMVRIILDRVQPKCVFPELLAGLAPAADGLPELPGAGAAYRVGECVALVAVPCCCCCLHCPRQLGHPPTYSVDA